MRSSRVVRASDCHWRSRNSRISGVADEAVLNTLHRKSKKSPLLGIVKSLNQKSSSYLSQKKRKPSVLVQFSVDREESMSQTREYI